jgi:hypothetical protein
MQEDLNMRMQCAFAIDANIMQETRLLSAPSAAASSAMSCAGAIDDLWLGAADLRDAQVLRLTHVLWWPDRSTATAPRPPPGTRVVNFAFWSPGVVV